jgi:hypothetical protein
VCAYACKKTAGVLYFSSCGFYSIYEQPIKSEKKYRNLKFLLIIFVNEKLHFCRHLLAAPIVSNAKLEIKHLHFVSLVRERQTYCHIQTIGE